MIHRIESDELIKIQDVVPVADVRTPAEFEKGHIPGAFNLPLFSNEERVLVGFEVFLVKCGYKGYRKWVLRQFEENYTLYVLGGLTGSGKTKILHQLRLLGEQVIDLEDIAQHQGSSYGTLNRLIQPSQEQ